MRVWRSSPSPARSAMVGAPIDRTIGRMIARYTRPELGAVWTDEARMTAWRDVEVAAAEALESGPTPEDLEAIRGATFTVEAVKERERITDHDVAAFVDVLRRPPGPGGRWIHYGLTSSDVLDTALALQIRRAGGPIVAGARELAVALAERAREFADTLCVGPHPRRARRADHVRPQARRLRVRGAPQRRPARARVRPGRGRGDLRRRRHATPPRPGVRGARAGAPRASRARTSRPRSSRATATPSCCRRSRSPAPGSSASRPRSATSSAPRSARPRSRSAPARRARARCRTSATRSPPSASPASRACCAATRRRRSRTSRCGTSATSRTPAPSA